MSEIQQKYQSIDLPVVVEAITFDQLVAIGRTQVPKEQWTRGMPWSFSYNGHPITHENDECYLVPIRIPAPQAVGNLGPTHYLSTARFTPNDMLVTRKGDLHIMSKDEFRQTYAPVALSKKPESLDTGSASVEGIANGYIEGLALDVSATCERWEVSMGASGDGRRVVWLTTTNDDTKNWIFREYESDTLVGVMRNALLKRWIRETVKPHEPVVPSVDPVERDDKKPWFPRTLAEAIPVLTKERDTRRELAERGKSEHRPLAAALDIALVALKNKAVESPSSDTGTGVPELSKVIRNEIDRARLPGPGSRLFSAYTVRALADHIASLEQRLAEKDREFERAAKLNGSLIRGTHELQDRLAAAEADTKRLKGVIERDRTAAYSIANALDREIRSRRGMATSRGSYEYDDDEYRKEFTRALDAIQGKVDAFRNHTRVHDLTDCPTTQDDVLASRSRETA